jgi:hypothetical protein
MVNGWGKQAGLLPIPHLYKLFEIQTFFITVKRANQRELPFDTKQQTDEKVNV